MTPLASRTRSWGIAEFARSVKRSPSPFGMASIFPSALPQAPTPRITLFAQGSKSAMAISPTVLPPSRSAILSPGLRMAVFR